MPEMTAKTSSGRRLFRNISQHLHERYGEGVLFSVNLQAVRLQRLKCRKYLSVNFTKSFRKAILLHTSKLVASSKTAAT